MRKLSSAGSYTLEYVGSAKTGEDTIGQTPDHNRQQLDVLDQVLVSSWSYSSANTSVWFVLGDIYFDQHTHWIGVYNEHDYVNYIVNLVDKMHLM